MRIKQFGNFNFLDLKDLSSILRRFHINYDLEDAA